MHTLYIRIHQYPSTSPTTNPLPNFVSPTSPSPSYPLPPNNFRPQILEKFHGLPYR